MYDIMVKRMHEYKRQLMNILYVIHRYLCIKETPGHERANKFVPRVVMIGGKAAPGYHSAKAIIKLINAVADRVNHDGDVGDLLKVVFLPNYNVGNAQIIIPAAELNQHISTAGTEASGTSNMKFVMNGGLIIGTMDGANVEIAEEISKDNMFIFGANVQQINDFRNQMRGGRHDYIPHRMQRCIDTVRGGMFGDVGIMNGVFDGLYGGNDHYCLGFDFDSYLEAQDRVDATYKDQEKWTKMSIIGVAHSGKFSSDRTIQEYCEDIWKVEPVPVPAPTTDKAKRQSYTNLDDAK